MSYGINEYLMDKSIIMSRNMRKYAMSFEEAERYKAERAGSGFHPLLNPIVTGGNRPIEALLRKGAARGIPVSSRPNDSISSDFNKGLKTKFTWNYKDAERAREQEKDKGVSPKHNASGATKDEKGATKDEKGAPEASLKDIIIQHVLANKYTYGGALGVGGAGAAIGALSSNENRLRNALLGGGIGAILGGVSGHIADRFIS